jgi:quercetin dioxygenase-like cupin family protein
MVPNHSTPGTLLEETVTPVFRHDIPNVDQRTMVALLVTYSPGGKSPVHRHAPSAFIYAHVLSGAIRSQVDDGPPRTFEPGEGFYENPGSHHIVSENASATETASMLAIFIVNPEEEQLTIADADEGLPLRPDRPDQEP